MMDGSTPLSLRLASHRKLADAVVKLDHAFAPQQVIEARRQLTARLGQLEPKEPPLLSLEKAWQRAAAHWGEHRTLHGLSRRDLRLSLWVMFDFPARSEPDKWLGSDPEFLATVFQWYEASGRTSVLRVLLRVFLTSYPIRSATFESFRNMCAKALAGAADNPRLEIWNQRNRLAFVFQPDGAHRLAQKWSNQKGTFRNLLDDCGLGVASADGAFIQAVLLEAIRGLEARIRAGKVTPAELSRYLDALIGEDDQLRYPTDRAVAAHALLRPHIKRSFPRLITPSRDFLAKHLQHPRVRTDRWARVEESAKRVMLGWLLQGTFDDFFALLDATALDEQWQERKAFWTRYLEREHIHEAWMVLGADAQSELQTLFPGQTVEGRYGRLKAGRYIYANHSVLIMRLDTLIVTEWSHVGPCRIWDEADAVAPPLYAERYTGDMLRSEAEATIPHKKGWQRRVARAIEENTGIAW